MTRFASMICLFAVPAFAQEGLGVRVNRALDAAAANLVTRQEADGAWQKSDKVHPLGRTALCTYALLHAGYAPDHESVRKALRFLRLDDPGHGSELAARSTYEAGCLLLLLHALGPAYDAHIQRTCAWLVKCFDDGHKLWGYPDGTPDLSNTQFAVFGLKVGEMHGFKVGKELWRDLLRSVPRLQTRDGAFRYRTDSLYRASMTHAALIVMRLALGGRRPPADLREAIRRGHDWFARHYRVDVTPWGRGHHHGYYYYYMYGLARYAQIFGLEEIAGRDWYRDGAEELLRRQDADGSWGSLEDTCFAILFLRKVVFTRPTTRAQGTAKLDKKDAEDARPAPRDEVEFLRRWLVAGPFRGEPYEDDLLFDDHFNVPRAAPGPGRAAGKRKWAAYDSPEDKIDLVAACGVGDWSVYYAASYLHAADAVEAVLWLGTDDGCKVYLNGEEVLEGHHHDYSGDDFYRIPLRLKKGRNLLLLKVENHGYYAVLKARIATPEGAPEPRVKATLSRRP